jgi:hypothetical protein
LKQRKPSPFRVMRLSKVQLNAEATEGLNDLLLGLKGNAIMRKTLLISAGFAVLQIAALQIAAAAGKYQICVTCSDGEPHLMGSPTPNGDAIAMNSFCTAKNAPPAVSSQLAKLFHKNNGQSFYACAKKVGGGVDSNETK